MVHALPLTKEARTDFVLAIFYSIFAVVAVGLRVLSKRVSRQRLTGDDYAVFAALVFLLGMTIGGCIQIVYGGMGRHIDQLEPANMHVFLKIVPVFGWTWAISLMFVKIAFLLLFSRIFFVGKSKLPIHIAMTIVLMWGLGQTITVIVICRPFAFNWDFTIPDGKCGNRPASYITVGFFHIATDIMIMIIPIPFLLKLQLGRAKKVSLLVIFGLGFGCCIISLIRVVELFQVTYSDITYSLVFGAYWTMLEPSLAILVVSAPVMVPLFERIPGVPSALRTVTKRSNVGTNKSRSFKKIGENKATLSNSNLTKSSDNGDFEAAEHVENGAVDEHADDYHLQYMELKGQQNQSGITRTKTVSQTISRV